MFVDKIAKWLMFLCCIFECRLKIKFLMSYVLMYFIAGFTQNKMCKKYRPGFLIIWFHKLR